MNSPIYESEASISSPGQSPGAFPISPGISAPVNSPSSESGPEPASASAPASNRPSKGCDSSPSGQAQQGPKDTTSTLRPTAPSDEDNLDDMPLTITVAALYTDYVGEGTLII
ncbi:hypothetical protein TWF696_009448 [Orbilia brochopaga]|uniref:Uncharacterized protein n=1 Tax=Orbilia brochopaga TaxID=3140254 RepID=A0AAV9UAM4_9PEZI